METSSLRGDQSPGEAEPSVPATPWTDLPSEADFDEEIRWVHQQYVLIVVDTGRGRVVRWDRATTRPPSTGACSLALWAATNQTGFYKDLLPKILKDEDPQEDEMVRRERKRIEEIKEVLMALLHFLN